MTKLILTAIVTIIGAGFWFWRRYLSKSAIIGRLETQLDEIKQEMYAAKNCNDIMLWTVLDNKRLRTAKKIRTLRS